MSKRDTITQALITVLSGIKKTAAYNTDLGNYIYAWRVDKIGADINYMCDVRDVRIERATKSETYNLWDWWIVFELVIIAKTLTDLRNCVDDVYKCIGANNTLSGNVIYIEQPESDSIEVVAEEQTYFGSMITLRALYRTEIWQS